MLARKELDQVSLDLLAAADLLEECGWIRGTRLAIDGSRCLLGAIDGVIRGTTDLPHTIRLANVIEIEGSFGDPYNFIIVTNDSPPGWKIAAWNNAICKDKDEAVSKLREAAYL